MANVKKDTKKNKVKNKKAVKEVVKIKKPARLGKDKVQPKEVEKKKKRGKGQIYLSVIIPAYNEAERLPITLIDVDKKLQEMDLPSYEILVVDDGSTDGTAAIGERFKSIIAGLKVVGGEENRGKGYSVRQGMLAAQGEVRIFTDADNSTTIDQFVKMQPYFADGAQVVIGSRAIAGAELDPPQPFYKGIMGKLGNLFIQAVVLPGVWDTQCGFKAFTAAAAEDIFRRARVNRWAFDIEALALTKKLGYEMREIPVRWVNDTRSHVKMSSYLQVLVETVKIAMRLKEGAPSAGAEEYKV